MPYLTISVPKSAAAALNPLMFAGIGGLAGGALGGLASSQVPEHDDEDAGGRRRRIVRDALLSAVAGAGVGGLGAYGVNQLNTARPLNDDSAMAKLTGGWKTPAVGAGIGVGLGAGASVKGVANAQGALAKKLGVGNTAADYQTGTKSTTEVENIFQKLKGGPGGALSASRQMHAAGTPVHTNRLIEKILQKLSDKPGMVAGGLRRVLPHTAPAIGALEQGAFHLGSGRAALGGITLGAIPMLLNALSQEKE